MQVNSTQSARRLIEGPAAWTGSQIQQERSWVHHLDGDALAELDAALSHAKRAGTRVPYSKTLFPLE
ncbi:MAG TPA: hypothetical protein VFP00_07120, partial [Burkholderiales bacterium]|nr:hypothetical protein [Burkholderiales bacterium]